MKTFTFNGRIFELDGKWFLQIDMLDGDTWESSPLASADEAEAMLADIQERAAGAS